jgi:hypothetical protein
MPNDIKWPRKVTRYRIQRPFQRLLIAKHEKQIDKSSHRIESGEPLDRYLREGLGPQIRQQPALWSQLPSCYRDDPALQRVHHFATGT